MPNSLYPLSRFTPAGLASAFVLVLGGLFAFGNPMAFGASTPQCTITGTPGNDVLNGTSKADVICGLGGDDTINGGAGSDTILGGDGNDVLNGGGGNDKLNGGAGIDTVTFSDSTSPISASLQSGKATGAGTDTLTADENLTGGKGNDLLTGNANANTLSGGIGNDKLNGGAGSDTVDYSTSPDGVKVDLGAGTSTGQGSDTLTGDENVIGGRGNDTITGSGSGNVISSGEGNDHVEAGAGADTVTGGPGDDGMIGGAGADDLNGEGGVNLCDSDAADKRVSYCGFDSSAPVITSIDFSTTSVDTSTGPVVIKVTLHATDDLVGITGAQVWLGFGRIVHATGSMTRIAGNGLDAIYQGEIRLPAGVPQGQWLVGYGVGDAVGNSASWLATSDAGPLRNRQGDVIGPASIQQTGQGDPPGDSLPPVVKSIGLSTASVDTSSGPATIKVTMRITDDKSGVWYPLAVCLRNGQSTYCASDTELKSGNATDGSYEGSVTVPKSAPHGTFLVSYQAADAVGNFIRKEAPSDGSPILDSMGNVVGPGSVEQTGPGDSSAPVVRSLTFSSTAVDTSSGTARIKVTMRVTDDMAGVVASNVALHLVGGSGQAVGTGDLVRIGGTELDGTYEGALTLKIGYPRGLYRVAFRTRDAVGNENWAEAPYDGSPFLDAQGNIIGPGAIRNG